MRLFVCQSLFQVRVISSLSIYQGIPVVSLAATWPTQNHVHLKCIDFLVLQTFKSGLIVRFPLRSVDISLECKMRKAHLV